jgi:Tfp pilus assembly protein PilN
MSKVNLLPESHFRKVAHRCAFRRRALQGLVLLAVGIGCFAVCNLEARRVHRLLVTEQQRLDLEREQSQDLGRLSAQHGQFRASEDLLADLEEPVPIAAILASLARAVPEEVVLNRLVVDAPNDMGASNPARVSGTTKAPANGRPIKIELGGLAHSDREVVRCLSRIADQPLFVNVKLGKSRHIQESRSSTVAFQITLEVPTNREVIVAAKDGSHGN